MAASLLRAAEDELSCPICFELFMDPNTPKILPVCGHVCCVVCLKKMAAGMCDKKCPECRKIVSISKDGVTSFLTNFRLRTLADNHRKIADGQSLSVGQTTKPSGSTCLVHKDEKMRLYCTTCNVLTCQLCMIQKHKGTGHNIESVEEKYSQQKDEMRSFIKKGGHNIKLARNKKRKLQTQVELEDQSLAATEKQIDDCVELCVNKVLENSQSLKNQAQKASGEKRADLQQKIADVDEEIQSAESNHRDAANALENKPDYEYITQHASLVDKMKRLRLEGRVSRSRKTSYAAAQFQRAIPPDMTIGRIVILGQKRDLESIQILDGFELATNTAFSADGLVLAVCDPVCDIMSNYTEKKIMIYHKASNGQYEKSHILDMRSSNEYRLTDVAICSDGRCLVAKCSCMEVYNTPEGNYLKSITTADPLHTPVNIFSVTTTSDGRILAGDIATCVITEHDPTGNIVRTIKTKTQPFYITLIRDTHIAISDWKSGKVSVMNIESGQKTLSIDIPEMFGICYDEQTDCLLVVRGEPLDSSNPGYVQVLLNTGVIEQYCCTTGRLVACLAKELYNPQGIGLSSDGILAVANVKTVNLYKIQ